MAGGGTDCGHADIGMRLEGYEIYRMAFQRIVENRQTDSVRYVADEGSAGIFFQSLAKSRDQKAYEGKTVGEILDVYAKWKAQVEKDREQMNQTLQVSVVEGKPRPERLGRAHASADTVRYFHRQRIAERYSDLQRAVHRFRCVGQ